MMLFAESGQWERERTLPTVSYPNGNTPTTGYKYSLQPNKKSVYGKLHDLPGKIALAELTEVGDLIVNSTQKELPVKEAFLESNEYGNGETEYISGPVPTSPTADKPPELVSSDDDDDDDDDDDAEAGDDNPHRRKSIEELLQFIKERSYDSLQPGPPVTKLAGMESSVGTHIDKSKRSSTRSRATGSARPAEHVTKNSTLEGYSYDQSTDKQIVYGKRNELPDKTA